MSNIIQLGGVKFSLTNIQRLLLQDNINAKVKPLQEAIVITIFNKMCCLAGGIIFPCVNHFVLY